MMPSRVVRRLRDLLVLAALLLLWPACGTASPAVSGAARSSGSPAPARHLAGTIHEFPLPSAGQSPQLSVVTDLAVGPDGALWFAETVEDPQAGAVIGKIGRMTTAGRVTEFTLAGDMPLAIATGPDGALWFDAVNPGPGGGSRALTGKIGRITTAGQVREFGLGAGTQANSIVAAPDGALWFTEVSSDPQSQVPTGTIGRITTAGSIREFPLPSPGTVALALANGPDRTLWFTAHGVDPQGNGAEEIGRITLSGAVSTFPVPATRVVQSALAARDIAAGPDGNLWFTEITQRQGLAIGRITPGGKITDFPLSAAGQPASSPLGAIVAGADNALWFTDPDGNAVDRITPAGTITGYHLPTAGASPLAIAVGPDGTLWFTEAAAGKIGHLD